MRRKKQFGFKILSVIGVIFLLVALSLSVHAEVKEIRFSTGEVDEPSQTVIKRISADYERLHPDVKIKLEAIGIGESETKIVAAVAAGTVPDIALFLTSWAFALGKQGHLLPLNDIVDAVGREKYFPHAIASSEGNDWTFPSSCSAHCLWYRKDMFDEKGLTPPTNWEEWLAAAEVLTEPEKEIYGMAVPMAIGSLTDKWLQVFSWQAGRSLFDENLNVTFDTPEMREALQFYKKLSQYSPPGRAGYSYGEMISAFASGKVAMTMYPGRILGHLQRFAPDILPYAKVTAWPGNKIQVCTNAFDPYVAFKASKHPEETKDFLKYIFTGERLSDFCLSVPTHLVPPLVSVAFSPEHLLSPEIKPYIDVALNLYNQMFYGWDRLYSAGVFRGDKIVPSVVENPYWMAIGSVAVQSKVVQKYILFDEPLDETIQWGQKEIEKIVAREKERFE